MKDEHQSLPFGITPSEVTMDNRLTLETMRVLVALFSFRNKVTGLAWPSREELSIRCGNMHPSNISEATTKLVELGWLLKEGKGGHSKSTRYTLSIPEEVTAMEKVFKQKSEERKAAGRKVAEQATVAQSATVAEQATPRIAEQATGGSSRTGYTQRIAEQATRIEHTNGTDQIGTDEGTHTETSVCKTPTLKPGIAGAVCNAIIRQGVQGCNPHHPVLMALIDAGADEEEFSFAARDAIARGNHNFAYVVGIVKRQREEAAKLILHKGKLPNKQESLEAANPAAVADWVPPELRGNGHAN